MGLGGVLRFPALCMEYGGAFVVAYAAVLAVFACPLLAAELSSGRGEGGVFFRGGQSLPLCLRAAGGGVRVASALNSAAVCAGYGVMICLLAVRCCTFYAHVNYAFPADMPQLTPVILPVVSIAAAFILSRGVRLAAAAARISVCLQAAVIAAMAACGLLRPGGFGVLAKAFAVDFAVLASCEVWVSAAGQALLSLSLAAGVMPSFAAHMPPSLSSSKAAAIIVSCNFFGGVLSSVAALTLAGGGGWNASSGALQNALTLYPAALSSAFSNGYICGLFGTAFYVSLTFTAFVSALSLARPAYDMARSLRLSARTAAFAVCAVLGVCGLPFAFGMPLSLVDVLCCNIVAPAVAVCEIFYFLLRSLTARRCGGKIEA